MEDKKITIEEVLAEYKENDPDFYYAYLGCYPINEIEGSVLEDATYLGYAIKDKYGNRYFTEYGIRGISIGTFFIYQGEPHLIEKIPTLEQLSLIGDILDDSDVYFKLRRNWYEHQMNKIKNK